MGEVALGAMGRDWPMACNISALLAGGIITYNGPMERERKIGCKTYNA